ncbi:P-loop containing nucleoside triphosphate hydrolase protein [Chaetomium tenue]|uniref:P-loop containing nucleoside triphosphate hydrolase protein n=1 Tax=Chaetomium tenue TaxID=1854479 RepID=A0ACB7PQC2_9PEZI|nr:P-loop containing nucleoside triphosphate hydrolase protein [Chaetomium globosum]
MAPGAISEASSAAVEETRQRIEVVSINGKKVDDAVNGTNGVNDEKPVNGDSQTEKKDDKDETAVEAKTVDEAKADGEKDTKDETTDEPEDQTMKCEIKHLDRRYDDDDEAYFAERKTEVEKPKQKDWWRLFAFCMVRTYDSDNELEGTSLYVNPQPLRQLLFDVIGNYPGNPIDVNDVQIEAPYRSLFYYRTKLETVGLERFAEDEESLEHLKLLLNWIKTHFELDIAAYERCTSQPHKVIAYDRLWTIFPPGTIAYCKLLSQNRAFRVNDTYYDASELSPCMGLRSDFVDFDGERLGTRNIELAVPKYQGTRELSDLAAIPLDLIDDASDLREELLARGRKFEAHVGQHFVQYDGIAIKKTPEGYARFTVNGRVMIDCKTYHRLEPNDSFVAKNFNNDSAKMERSRKRALGHLTFAGADGERKFEKLSEENLILTNATVRGYSFTTKRFLEFFVEDISEIEWNTKCFDDLVLDAAIKKTVQALVSTHSKKRETFDDIVKGKGMGLVCVLHGPPGVGKTLTAECVAEFVKRPLYMVSSGDLGTNSADLDRNLTRIMDMTATWRAVLLIDEADVFLERRSLHDMHRNAMVSVFLRVLEYYSGILFLTTNRVTTFDDAFKSRIHIPIRYTDLSIDSRRQIWRNFCRMVPGGVDIDDKGLSTLADTDLNGRQIKNAIKAAESLAAFDGAKLDLNQLLQITKIQAMFESDLTNLSGVDYTAPGSSKKDADSRNMFL